MGMADSSHQRGVATLDDFGHVFGGMKMVMSEKDPRVTMGFNTHMV